jgi:hypothetical protein
MAVSEGDNILNTQFNNLVDRLVSNYASYMGQQLRSGQLQNQVPQLLVLVIGMI